MNRKVRANVRPAGKEGNIQPTCNIIYFKLSCLEGLYALLLLMGRNHNKSKEDSNHDTWQPPVFFCLFVCLVV